MSNLRWYNFTSFHSHVFIHKTLLSLFLLFSLSSHEPFYYPLLPLAAYFFFVHLIFNLLGSILHLTCQSFALFAFSFSNVIFSLSSPCFLSIVTVSNQNCQSLVALLYSLFFQLSAIVKLYHIHTLQAYFKANLDFTCHQIQTLSPHIVST